MGRLSRSSMGGSDPWDQSRYLNIWIGDLRVLEPKLNNFEELIFLGLATPPSGLDHWSEADGMDKLLNDLNDGVFIHYNTIGPNNPAKFQAPYQVYNGVVTEGKILVHETGHYLGLRHIWGDGDCAADDFIDDTPRSSSSSQFTCNKSLNSCTDTIENKDLPNMVENYMDYSNGSCQNMFTKGQAAMMRFNMINYRRTVYTPIVSKDSTRAGSVSVTPLLFANPGRKLILGANNYSQTIFDVSVYDNLGRLVLLDQPIELSNPREVFAASLLKRGQYIVKAKNRSNGEVHTLRWANLEL